MITDYLIVASATAMIALIWRMLLLDHEALRARVRVLPGIGGALTCGFCFPVWLSLAAVLVYNPLTPWAEAHGTLLGLAASWLSLAAGVLLIRNALAALMEGAGVLTHLHRQDHRD